MAGDEKPNTDTPVESGLVMLLRESIAQQGEQNIAQRQSNEKIIRELADNSAAIKGLTDSTKEAVQGLAVASARIGPLEGDVKYLMEVVKLGTAEVPSLMQTARDHAERLDTTEKAARLLDSYQDEVQELVEWWKPNKEKDHLGGQLLLTRLFKAVDHFKWLARIATAAVSIAAAVLIFTSIADHYWPHERAIKVVADDEQSLEQAKKHFEKD